MDISKTNEQQKDEGKDIKEKSKELWLFQFDNELDVDQKELENLIGSISFLYNIFLFIFKINLLIIIFIFIFIIIYIYFAIFILLFYILLFLELETGEFNFETLNTLYIQDSNYEFIEYHLFIKAIYNLLER